MHDGVLDYLETEVTQLFNDQYWSSSFCVTTTRLLDSINLRLIPFGNSEYYKRANNYKCQNGTQECKAQFYQYCALKKYDVYNSFPYYKCIQAYAFLRILMLIVIGTVMNYQIGLGNVLTTTSLIRLTWRAALKIAWMYVTHRTAVNTRLWGSCSSRKTPCTTSRFLIFPMWLSMGRSVRTVARTSRNTSVTRSLLVLNLLYIISSSVEDVDVSGHLRVSFDGYKWGMQETLLVIF